MEFNRIALLALLVVAGMSFSWFAASANADSLSILEASAKIGSLANFSAALQKLDLIDTLNNKGVLLFGNLSFAVFAPTDAAFANVTGIDLMANETDLKRVLNYHMVPAYDSLGNLTNGTSLQTMQGENLTVVVEDDLIAINGAKVLEIQEYNNGTIYVIDSVLMPQAIEKGGIGVIEAAKSVGLNRFSDALTAAGFGDRLNDQAVLGIGILREGPFTIFAPSDEAFDSVDSDMLSAITANMTMLRTLLSYHMVNRDSAVNRTQLMAVKTLEGTSQAIDPQQGIVGGANILAAKRYDNGIIYEIDQVLMPMALSMAPS